MEEVHNIILKDQGYKITMSEDATRISKLYQNVLREFQIKIIMEENNLEREEAEIMYVLGERPEPREYFPPTTGKETQ
jgi:hypothetical protein